MGLGFLVMIFVLVILFCVLTAFGVSFAAVSWPIYVWPRRWVSYLPLVLFIAYLIHTGGELRFLF